jgi:hypothetical protein
MITGIVLGVLGVVAAGLGLAKRRRARKAGEVLGKVIEKAGPVAEKLEDTVRKRR